MARNSGVTGGNVHPTSGDPNKLKATQRFLNKEEARIAKNRGQTPKTIGNVKPYVEPKLPHE